MSTKISPAMLELRAVITEAEEISKRSEISKRDEARLNFLLAKMKALRDGAVAPENRTAKFFADLFRGQTPVEERAEGTPFQAGTQTISYGQGQEGGYLVPFEFYEKMFYGLAQIDPLLDENVVTVDKSDSFQLRPTNVPGIDASTFAASMVGETNTQQTANALTVSGNNMDRYTFRASLGLTVELEEDMFISSSKLMGKVFEIAFARGIGKKLAIGTGSSEPQGISNCTDSGVTTETTGGALVTYKDVENVYFAVNEIYRAMPKAGWLMTDAVYQKVRKAVDDQHRPLINIVGDKKLLMDKPVYITPSLPAYNASLGTQSAGSFCIFGDLSYFVVRASRSVITRNTQAPGFIENGKILYTGLMRADSKVIDPTAGSVPPVVSARLHS